MSKNNLSRRELLALLGASALTPQTLLAAPKTPTPPAGGTTVALGDLDLSLMNQGYGDPKRDVSSSGKPLVIGGRTFAHGVGTHADSRFNLHLSQGARRFRAFVGVDDDGTGAKSSLRFSVIGDGRELWNSGIRKHGDPAVSVDVDISHVQWLTLHVDDGGDGNAEDHADWAEAVFTGVTKTPVAVARLPEEENKFLPGRIWADTDGKRIQAHGGGILRYGNKWWWYGEDRSNGYIAIGTAGYVSDDLLHWKRIGTVLPRSAYDQAHGDQTLCERPKVIYNPTTRKFVLWFHYDKSGYGDSRGGVAIADRPEGPFQFLGAQRPIESSTFRDMNVFVDDDNKAYVFYAGEDNQTMHVVRLNAEWTGPEQPMVEGKTWARILIHKSREAPAPFKHAGKYFLLSSACTGWAPNAADLAVADNPLGPYTMQGNPCVGPDANTTFGTQSTFVLPTPGAPPGNFIYMGDHWKPDNLADSRYIWLPFRMDGTHTTLQWQDQWTLASARAGEV